VIRVTIDVPDSHVRRAEYVFKLFAQQWGIPLFISYGSDYAGADVRYTVQPHSEGNPGLCIPFDHRAYDPMERYTVVEQNGYRLWMRSGARAGAADIVGSSYRLLTLLDEQQVDGAARDRRGIFRTEALPPERRAAGSLPLVDDHAAFVLDRVARERPGSVEPALPKWPGGKRFAVAITHDTDAVSLGAPAELLTNMAKFALRRSGTYAGMVRVGLQHIRNPTGNPLFGFPLWRDLEEQHDLRSTFYLFVRSGRFKPDINNCKSTVMMQHIDWGILRSMADAGWEFGLHAPINAERSVEALSGAKSWIEDKLGVPVHGLRHHYWALDWTAPYKTWRRHAQSGYRYDTSIAWRDVTGFRAATCHPFRPFDPERDQPLDFYEVPTCVMDGHVVGRHNGLDGDVEAGLRTIERVRDRGGVAVLDWHTESACDDFEHKNVRTTLMRMIERLLADNDVWFAPAWEIVKHWQERCAALEAQG
jgi:hypothetical protein